MDEHAAEDFFHRVSLVEHMRLSQLFAKLIEADKLHADR